MIKDTIFLCPLCKNRLDQADKKFMCRENHSYDISREGYVNLLLPNMKRSSLPGDSAEMVRSRNRFLSAGYYSSLPGLLVLQIRNYVQTVNSNAFTILDAGCGEGYYLSFIEQRLAEYDIDFYGIDISKPAVKIAAKRNSNISYAVRGLFNMPVYNGSVDCLLNIFAPSPSDEFRRVLAPHGIVIHVHPGEEHLYSLREKLFTRIMPLRKEDRLSESFTPCSTEELKYGFTITGAENLSDLVNMTPYAWKTGRERISRFLEETETLETTAHFIISTYKKKQPGNS